VGDCVINLRVLKPDKRTGRLLAEVAKSLHLEQLSPKQGHAPIHLFKTTAAEGWDVVYAALQAADPERQELVTIGKRPKDREDG
jgi:hypothetical protein